MRQHRQHHRRPWSSVVLAFMACAVVLGLSACGAKEAQEVRAVRESSENYTQAGGAAPPVAAMVSAAPVPQAMTDSAGADGAVMAKRGAAMMAAPSAPEDTQSAAPARKVIHTWNIRLEVADYTRAQHSLESSVVASGGEVVNSQREQGDDGVSQGFITVRVPEKAAGTWLQQVQSLGKVLAEGRQSEDITRVHADNAARLKQAQAKEARLLALYQRSAKLSEVIELEQALSQARSDIESMQAQQKSWDLQVAMTTIHIQLSEPKPVIPRTGSIFEPLQHAVSDALAQVVRSTYELILWCAWLLPWMLVLVVVWCLLRLKARRGQRKRQQPSA